MTWQNLLPTCAHVTRRKHSPKRLTEKLDLTSRNSRSTLEAQKLGQYDAGNNMANIMDIHTQVLSTYLLAGCPQWVSALGSPRAEVMWPVDGRCSSSPQDAGWTQGAWSHHPNLLHSIKCIACLAVAQQAAAKAILIQIHSQGNVLFHSWEL